LNGTFPKFSLRALPDRVFLGTGERIASEHFEPGREGLESFSSVFLVSITTVLVVDQKTSVGDRLEFLGGGVLEVELREPVVGEILSNKARSAL